ncbi:CRISPR-associated endoribonuclease Cas6 [candidate division KSB3 bacterium]|uniref:CRISPR-associated endoribonuclease Cas6 n=1 Tax=candidate division KSB3 bacterium TaxID=2044937 RepID=A0A2G6E5E1_9BACT|nr:MAG: CRISPR-associated endoribonuclease Cas6 [candidate division KSB3 bacterium]PIE29712.1 MAG: CRISPR-associated endoribonuclease Cas6 [candidate division KSB3 bacterium]
MPFSILLQGYPTENAPVPHVQGATVQGMFLNLLEQVDPTVARRLHDDSKYRPYTLSPLGIGEPTKNFDGFRLPCQYDLRAGTPCYLRICLLEDSIFPTFSRYFLDRPEPLFRLGGSNFKVTDVLVSQNGSSPWCAYVPYEQLIDTASHSLRKITLQFLTPASFRRGNVDFPLPDSRLVFRSYRLRFEEFCRLVHFPDDFDEQVEFHTGIARLYHLETLLLKTKRVSLIGFTGRVTYQLDSQAPPDLIARMNLLADFAFFCGTGRKTAIGMGQTIRLR